MSVPSMVDRSRDDSTIDLFGEDIKKQHHTELPECKVKRNYSCNHCDFFTQNPRSFLYHLRDVHKEKVRIYECPNCLYASKHFQKLLRHTKMVHGELKTKGHKRPASPDEEDRDSPASNDESNPSDDTATTFKCSLCVYTAKSQQQLTKHERDEHIKTKFFRCSKCSYVTHMKARFTKHVKYHSMPMIKCDLCDFRTPYKWNLDRHCKNHNGKGAFRCSACNFTADIKQSLTVHEMNHHVPPVGQAAGLGVGRRRNKVGASDTTAAEEAALQESCEAQSEPATTKVSAKLKAPSKKASTQQHQGKTHPPEGGGDFVHPDDIVQHSNGNVYFKTKCAWCSYKTAWDGEMAKHVERAHGAAPLNPPKPKRRPVPNLIPLKPQKTEPAMSQKDINDICARSANSSLRDFASLFVSEDVFPPAQPKKTFFEQMKERLASETSLTCQRCGHESKCLSESCAHQKTCGKEPTLPPNITPIHKLSSTRCQHCRQRCKSSNDLYNHLQTCPQAAKFFSEQQEAVGDLQVVAEEENSNEKDEPHPMENRVFVWNNIVVPMDVELDEPNQYVYVDEKQEDTSLDHSIRTQSPDSISSVVEAAAPVQVPMHQVQQQQQQSAQHVATPPSSTDKIPTHGNDISVAQHKRVFKCPHCTFWASTASRFHVHIVGHLNKKPFECSLCAYRSNWRWDITKHIKLKSVRDPAHEEAKVLMTDETGRRNYTKYNKYLTEIKVPGADSQETSGGMGTRPKHQHQEKELPKAGRAPGGSDFGQLFNAKTTPLRPPPALKTADEFFNRVSAEKKKPTTNDGKKTLWQCKKCAFRDPCKEKLLSHVKSHYPASSASAFSSAECSPSSSVPAQRFTGAPGGADQLDSEASVGGGQARGQAPFQCGHCHQVSNWKHVIQRHCRLKHSGDIKVIVGTKTDKAEGDVYVDELPEHMDVPQSGTFKCSHCPYSTDDPDEFHMHPEGHNPGANSAFKCAFCNYSVSTKEELFQHLKLHGLVNPIEFVQRQVGEADQPGKRYRCAICPYVTNSKSQFMYHRQFHKPKNGQYACTQCSYNVSKRHLLHQHMKVHGIVVSPQKQNGDAVDFEEISDEIEEVSNQNYNWEALPEIPLVWVSKSGKFSKMYKCRYCPHVNLRKVNIQEHEKMHSVREKNPARSNETEHRCLECNYVCNNAGVLSSHNKVHQGLYGSVHGLVDTTKSDEEQIRELGHHNPQILTTIDLDEDDDDENMLYFCQQCPARFMQEKEFDIHKDFHGAKLNHRCEHCSYAARQKSYIQAHAKVHTKDYQDRTKALIKEYRINTENPPTNVTESQPEVYTVEDESSDVEMEYQPSKNRFSVPLSGTDLFMQKTEAEASEKEGMLFPVKSERSKEKKYKCPKCPCTFEKKDHYKAHLGCHGSKQQYKCSHCDYAVKYHASFVQHEKKHKAVDGIADNIKEEVDDEEMQETSLQPDVSLPEEKKLFWCQMCPYSNGRRDAVDNHQKRHVTISGMHSTHTCPHCDYSVPQQHHLQDHIRVHFQPNRIHTPEAYMSCDTLKLSTKTEEEDDDDVIFESRGDDSFEPPLQINLNNNNDEKLFVDTNTGDLVDAKPAS